MVFIKIAVKRALKQDQILHMEGKLRVILCFREEYALISLPTIFISEITRTLSLYPWYHGNIRRSDSANLILHKQVRHILSESSNNDSMRNNPMSSNTSGVFLVRISGTRHGEYVLTYNYHDRAKHMRLNILSDGQCRVQHLWFNR